MNSGSSAAPLIDSSVSSAPVEGVRSRGRKRSRELNVEVESRLGSEGAEVEGAVEASSSVIEESVAVAAVDMALSETSVAAVPAESEGESVEALSSAAEEGASPEQEEVSVDVASEEQSSPSPVKSFEADAPELPEGPVNYDEPGLLEVEIDEDLYRLDAGKQGTALCLSVRPSGSWRWGYLGEIRWDGRDLRSRALSRQLLERLSRALRQFIEETAN